MNFGLPKAYYLNWFFSIALALAPLLFVKNRDEYLPFLLPLIGLMYLSIYEHATGFAHQEKMRNEMVVQQEAMRAEITQKTLSAILSAQVVTEFGLQEAHDYVALSALRAKRIYNTRLARRERESISEGYMAARNKQDDGFKAAIKRGTEYHLVYDTSYADEVAQFCTEVKGPGAGILGLCPIDAKAAPMVQFVLLEYTGGVSECLVGYGLGDEITSDQAIYLIRSNPLCSYLKHVHQMYYRLMGVGQQRA